MAQRKMRLEDWLDDLCVRFVLNLPEADLTSMERIIFLVEEAHWFYDDFIRPLDPSLPSMNLRRFCLMMFQRCPLLAPFSEDEHNRAFDEFLKYKISVPVRGAILLNETMDSALLVKGWKKGACWGFPKGKINMDEDDLDCAIREVAEETGFDARLAGVVPERSEDAKFIDITFRDQQIRLYIFRGVSMDTYFEPKTRKEISKIQWYKIADLPTYKRKNDDGTSAAPNPNNAKFYMVAPFVAQLKKWVAAQKKKDASRSGHLAPQAAGAASEDVLTEDETAQPEPTPRQEVLQPQPQPPPGGYAAEDVLASASRELQRLLNMPAPAASEKLRDANQKTANALLAMLRADKPVEQNRASEAHTNYPVEDVQMQRNPQQYPDQYSPYQQQQQQQQQPQQVYQHQNYQQQAPPPFQMQGIHSGGQGPDFPGPVPAPYNPYGAPAPPNYPPQQRPQQMQQPQQLQQTQQQYQQQRPQQYPPVPQQMYGPQGPNMYAPNGRPQDLPPPPYAQNGRMAHPQEPPAPPPIPLLHPQPLPPTAQKVLFARESLGSPDVGAGAAARPLDMLIGPPPPPPPQHGAPQQQPPLSKHAITLLNAFKSTGGARVSNEPPQQQQPQQASQATLPQPPHAQHPPNLAVQNLQYSSGDLPHNSHALHGARPQPGPHVHGQTQAQPQPGPDAPAQNPALYNTAPAPHPVARHSEQHRNALLGMFKQQPQQPQQPQQQQQPQPPQQQPQPPQQQQAPQPQYQYQPQQQRGGYAEAATLSASKATKASVRSNGHAVDTNRNLPYGALTLLTRSKGDDALASGGGDVRSGTGAQHPSTYSAPIIELPAGAVQRQAAGPGELAVPPPPPVPGQVVRRPSYASSTSGSAFTPAAAGAVPPPPQGARPPENNPDHRQKLLSLFGSNTKPSPQAQAQAQQAPPQQPPQAPPSSGGGGSGGVFYYAPVVSGPASASSRGSLDQRAHHTAHTYHQHPPHHGTGAAAAPTGTAPTSRRGSSQTPITPADRNFLLGYLASMSGTQ